MWSLTLKPIFCGVVCDILKSVFVGVVGSVDIVAGLREMVVIGAEAGVGVEVIITLVSVSCSDFAFVCDRVSAFGSTLAFFASL